MSVSQRITRPLITALLLLGATFTVACDDGDTHGKQEQHLDEEGGSGGGEGQGCEGENDELEGRDGNDDLAVVLGDYYRTRAPRSTIDAGHYENLEIARGGADYYAVVLEGGGTLTTTIHFDPSQGDVQLEVQPIGNTTLTGGLHAFTPEDDDYPEIDVQDTAPGVKTVVVRYPRGGSPAQLAIAVTKTEGTCVSNYDMEVVAVGAAPCANATEAITNDAPATAKPVLTKDDRNPQTHIDGMFMTEPENAEVTQVPAGGLRDQDWYVVELPPGCTLVTELGVVNANDLAVVKPGIVVATSFYVGPLGDLTTVAGTGFQNQVVDAGQTSQREETWYTNDTDQTQKVYVHVRVFTSEPMCANYEIRFERRCSRGQDAWSGEGDGQDFDDANEGDGPGGGPGRTGP